MFSRCLLAVVALGATVIGGASARQRSDYVNRFPHLQTAPEYNLGTAPEAPTALGDITSAAVNPTTKNQVDIACGKDLLRVQFWRPDVVRVWLAWGGNFTDEASADIITGKPVSGITAQVSDKGDHYEITAGSSSVSLHAAKSPAKFSLYSAGGALLWAEAAPLSHNSTATFQTLSPSATETEGGATTAEAFFGGGMQNGRFVHTGTRIRISTDYNWADGGNPNSVPLYMSTNGYAVYRNTWKPGYYNFGTDGTVTTGHNETDRFDAFYFGVEQPRDFKGLLGAYTYLTGNPFMPPIYGLGLGDSDCYHNTRHGNNTRVVTAVADQYRAHDIPAAWFLPNDG